MAASPQRLLSRDRAWACVTLNFSLSGLGSLKAGRVFAGVIQLTTAFGGFFLLLAWMLQWIHRIFQAQIGDALSSPPAAWLWKSGVAGFVISYVWMLLTCVSLMRQAKADENRIRQNVPPKLVEASGRPPKISEMNAVGKSVPEPIRSALETTSGWRLAGTVISRTFQFPDFPAAMKFVDAVGELAERVQHHPDIDIRWNKVTLALTTHDAGGLTENDFALARQCDALALR